MREHGVSSRHAAAARRQRRPAMPRQGRLRDRDRAGHARTTLRRALRRSSWRLRHRADGRHAGRAAPDAPRLGAALLDATRCARHAGHRYQLPSDHRHLGDRPPRPARRNRRRVVATTRLRPRRRPAPARPPLGHPAAAARAPSVRRRARGDRPAARTSDTARDQACSVGRCRRSARRRTSRTRRSSSPMRSVDVRSRSSTRLRSSAHRAGALRASTSPCRRSGGASSSTSTLSTARSTGTLATPERRRDLHGVAWQIEVVTELDMADVEALADELVETIDSAAVQSSAS